MKPATAKRPRRSTANRKPRTATIHIERLPLATLKPHPRNPRVHPEPGTPAWDALKTSLAHDYFDPIVWNKRNGLLVSGHLRTKVLTAEGYTHADVSVVDYNEATHLARLLAANKLQGEDDREALAKIMSELDQTCADAVRLTGLDDAEIAELLTPAPVKLTKLDVRPPPKLGWVLIGIPLTRFDEIAGTIENIAKIPDTIVESTVTDEQQSEN